MNVNSVLPKAYILKLSWGCCVYIQGFCLVDWLINSYCQQQNPLRQKENSHSRSCKKQHRPEYKHKRSNLHQKWELYCHNTIYYYQVCQHHCARPSRVTGTFLVANAAYTSRTPHQKKKKLVTVGLDPTTQSLLDSRSSISDLRQAVSC